MYVISTEVEKSLQYDRNIVEVTENKYVIDARTRRICLLAMPSLRSLRPKRSGMEKSL